MKTSSSLKRFCPAATLFDPNLVLISKTSLSASTGALFYWLNLTSSVSSDVAAFEPSGADVAECIAGWLQSPEEEVPVSSSCFTQGLLIAENAL